MFEVKGNSQKRRPKKIWWDCIKYDLEGLGLSQKAAQFRNKWWTWIQGSRGKWPLKWSVCLCWCEKISLFMSKLTSDVTCTLNWSWRKVAIVGTLWEHTTDRWHPSYTVSTVCATVLFAEWDTYFLLITVTVLWLMIITNWIWRKRTLMYTKK